MKMMRVFTPTGSQCGWYAFDPKTFSSTRYTTAMFSLRHPNSWRACHAQAAEFLIDTQDDKLPHTSQHYKPLREKT